MGTEIEPYRREREREEAWERYMKGESVSSIARTLGRDRRTISKYVSEETSIIAKEQDAQDLLEKSEAHMQEMIRVAQCYLNDPTLSASSMAGPQWLKRWIEVVELQLKARGIIRPGGSAAIQQEGTIINMVTLLAEDMYQKGYLNQQEYLDSEGEVVEAEVIDEEYVEQENNPAP
jgi:hypothetical protein